MAPKYCQKDRLLSDAKCGSPEDVQRIIELYFAGNEGADSAWFYSSPKSGDTVSIVAARHGNSKLLQHLKERIPDQQKLRSVLEQTNRTGKRPVHEAAQNGHVNVLEFLLGEGVDINCTKQQDWTPIMLACTKADEEVVRCLLAHGADVTLKNKDGWNCFHIAAREGVTEILEALLDSEPSLWRTVSKNGRTPLHTAALHGRHGALQDVLLNQTRCLYPVDGRDNCGSTPLMEACRAGFVDVMESLLGRHEANILGRDNLDRTLLHIAAEAGQTDAISFILSYDVTNRPYDVTNQPYDVTNQPYDVTNPDRGNKSNVGNPPERITSKHTSNGVIRPSVGTTSETAVGNVILPSVTRTDDDVILPSVTRTDDDVILPSSVTRTDGDVTRNEFVNALTCQGCTALYLAAREGQAATVQLLLNQPGILVNVADQNGRTALHMAVIKRSLPTVSSLLSHGASDKQDTEGNFASDYAFDSSIRDILRSYHDDINTTS